MKKILIAVLVAAMCGLSAAYAGPVTWNFHDFGNNYFDSHNNTSDMSLGYPHQSDPFQPSPGNSGSGGERFDIEGINFAFDQTSIYISVTSSFKFSAHSDVWNFDYVESDLFFGFNGNNSSFAIDTQTGNLWRVDSYNKIPIVPGGYGSNAAISNNVGAYSVKTGQILGSVAELYTYYGNLEPNPIYQYETGTWIKEYAFNWADLGLDLFQQNSINIHTTIACGNDLANKSFGIVPEPGTMVLLGMGLLGMGAHLRRKKS